MLTKVQITTITISVFLLLGTLTLVPATNVARAQASTQDGAAPEQDAERSVAVQADVDYRRAMENQLITLRQERDDAAQAYAEASAELKQAQKSRDALRKELSMVVMSPANIGPVLERLEMQKLDDEIALEGKRARIEAIRKVIAEVAEEMKKPNSRQRMMLAELEGQVKLRELELARLMELLERGAVTEHEVRKAKLELEQVMVQLEAIHEELRSSRESDEVRILNNELRTLSIDLAELEHRLQYVNKRSALFLSSYESFEKYDQLVRTRIPALEQTVLDRREAYRQLESKVEEVQQLLKKQN